MTQHLLAAPHPPFSSPSCVQLYNEEVNDLLKPANKNLDIRSAPDQNTVVAGLTEQFVSCKNDVLRILDQGDQHRKVGETLMNAKSSRSHTVFKVVRTPASAWESPARTHLQCR